MGSTPERRAALAASATCLALAILDFEMRLWDDVRRVLLLVLCAVIAVVAGMLFTKNRGAVVVLGAVVGLFITTVELAIAKHVWPGWAIAAGLAWPVSLTLVVVSARVVAKPGSILHSLSASLPWLVPAALCAWTGSAAVVLCVWHLHGATATARLKHFMAHPWALGLVIFACVLAGAQIVRSAAGVRLRAGRRDLGLGVAEQHEDAPMSAYRAGPMVVSAKPQGARALFVYGSVAGATVVLCALALAPVLANRTMCVCEMRTSLAERDRSPREWIGRGDDQCAADDCVVYSPVERITAIAPAPTQPMGTFDIAGPVARQPVLVLADMGPELLPSVTVYEDGLVIVARGTYEMPELVAGTIAEPTKLAAGIAKKLEDLSPRIVISGATDQPEPTIFARTDGVWRGVSVVGFRAGGRVSAPTAEAPPGFVEAYDTLSSLHLDDAHPYTPEDFVVEMHEQAPGEPADWPASVPAPPPLVPDERYYLRPRTYDLHGEPGMKLRELARKRQGYAVRLSNNESVSLNVRMTIPSGQYVEKLHYCQTWSAMPFHVCDIRLPGRK